MAKPEGAVSAEAAELAARIERGDQAAEVELIERYSRGIMFLLRKHTRDPDLAADLHQDAFQIVLLKLRAGEVRKPESLASFIRQVAINVTIDYFRKQRRRGEYPDSELIERVEATSRGPVHSLEQAELALLVQQTIDELPTERDRILIRLYYIEQQPKPQICATLRLSAEHFDRVIYRAKQRLRQLLLFKGGAC